MCVECGEKRYKKIRGLEAITVSMGVCPICGKKKTIVPARDWAYRAGERGVVWD